jgi:hypothetical protein
LVDVGVGVEFKRGVGILGVGVEEEARFGGNVDARFGVEVEARFAGERKLEVRLEADEEAPPIGGNVNVDSAGFGIGGSTGLP